MISLGPEQGETEKMLKKLVLEDIDSDKKTLITELVTQYIDIMEYDQEKPNIVPNVKHRIVIEKGKDPIKQRYYRETPDKREFIVKEIDKMLRVGCIRESYSPSVGHHQ